MYFDKTASLDQHLRKLSGLDKDSLETICDHNYVKHWSSHIGSERTKPARMLFMVTSQRSEPTYIYSDEEIDVVNDSENSPTSSVSPFDSQRIKLLAYELEHSLKTFLNEDTNGTELDDFPIENESPRKRKVYHEVMGLVNFDKFAKMVYSGQKNEYIRRKIVTEKCARQLRIVLANTFYDFDVILWIHQLILDKGNLSTVASYLSLLQALRVKIPSLIDRILKSYSGKFGFGYLSQLLRKTWEPCAQVINQHKPKKLPRNPLLIMNCAGFNLTKALNESPRFHFWTSHLNALCKTIHIPMKYREDGCTTFGEAIEDLLLALRSKITEFKNHYPNRPVILAGWTIGALISCLVGLETEIDAIICFGFSLTGVNGSRGGLDDPLLDSKVPTLFIVGQNSNTCSIDDIEDFRSRMKAVSGLVVVGGADDLLNVSPQKMLTESITQEIVDRCILDEINNFLEVCLTKPQAAAPAVVASSSAKSCPPIREESPDIINPDEVGKRKRRRPKEYSPELISSRKKACHSAAKENQAASRSPVSRPGRRGRHPMPKTAKPNQEKRGVGRPAGSGTGRRKAIDVGKPAVAVSSKAESSVPRVPKADPALFAIPPPEEPAPKESKPEIPFALNILPKKNVPVDVEKAFGSDSSFLPRPLTPPDPEDNTVSAEETENTLGELDAGLDPASATPETPSTSFSNQPCTSSFTNQPSTSSSTKQPSMSSSNQPGISSSSTSQPSTSSSTSQPSTSSFINQPSTSSSTSPPTTNQDVPPSEKPIVKSTPEQSSGQTETKLISGSMLKHIITSGSEATAKLVTVSTASSGIKTVFLKDRALAGSVQHLKNVTDASFVTRTLGQIKSTAQSSKTMITVPLNAGPLLVSGQTLKTPSGKIFQFLSKSPASSSLQTKETLKAKLVSSHEAIQQVYNSPSSLSSDRLKKVSGTSSSATLVKLAAPDKSQNVKQVHVIKPSQSRSDITATKVETTAEIIEKQLAIQALNESVGLESSQEGTVAYSKPSASIISRVIPRSSHPPYMRQSIIAHPSMRGRMRPILPNKIYQMFPK